MIMIIVGVILCCKGHPVLGSIVLIEGIAIVFDALEK